MNYATNRDRRMEPKRGLGYCNCDMSRIRAGQKCPACGRVMKRRTLKRTPAPSNQ